MGLIVMLEKTIKKMKWYDVSLVKLSVFFFTLLLIVAWDGFRVFVLQFAWYWYALLFALVTVPVLCKMFSK